MDQHGPSSPSTHLTRRTLIGASAARRLRRGRVVVPLPRPREVRPRTQWLPKDLVRRFAAPGTATAAGFRWWWPHGLVDPVEIAREVDQVADAGFGVLEVADVTHSLRARNITIDVASHGWGTAPWVAGVKAALARAAERQVRIDITVGPSWPAAVSTITPDDEAACTELAHGRADLAAGATYDGPVPEAVLHAGDAVTKQTLVALQAHRYTPSSNTRVLPQVDPDSYVDLLGEVVDGRLTWTAPTSPAGGSWVLLSWQRGSGQEPEAAPHTDPRSYVVDHFSAAGSQAVVDLWEDRVLDRELRALLGRAGGYLFEDSLEIETEATIWTPRMFEEFEKRAGYDIRPWLPVVMELKEKYLFDLGTGPQAATDGLRTNQVRDDYNQVLSDLYRDHHLLPLQAFARTLGMGLRVQPYGLETDTVEHAALLDVPETESLGFKNLDDYRVMAGGRDMAGHTILSCEAICYNGAAYNTMLGANSASPTQQNQALFTLNSIFAGGVNQAIIHGFPYATAPGVTWPGFAAFSPYYNGAIGFGEAWGPRTPQWQHMPDVAAYLARTQLVLQTGTPKYDVVFLRQKGWTSTGIGAFWATNDGIPLGWTHSFATPALLDLPRAKVRDGRLAPDGPAYKVMIVGTDQFRGQVATIAVSTARKVLELGRAGLPIVFVRDWSDPRPVGLPEGATDAEAAELRRLVAAIKALPTTREAAADADIPGALASLGITPDVEHERSTVMTVRRVLGDVDLYYVANARHAENRRLTQVTQDVWLTTTSPRAVPVQLDAWTGEARPVGLWERRGDRVRVRVDLAPGQSTVIAMTAPQSNEAADLHAVATTALDVLKEPGKLLLRAATAGEHTATLGDGRTVRTTVGRVRTPVVPASWRLEVEDWQPGATATETVKPVRTVDLTSLVPWSQVPGLEDVSGVGRYTTEVDLGSDWTDQDGAWLELGEVTDTYRVTVNGVAVGGCDPLRPRVDVGHLLRRGRNTIVVEVASTLLNRLRTVTPAVYGVAQRQAYGLLGPVRLVPYVDQQVRR